MFSSYSINTGLLTPTKAVDNLAAASMCMNGQRSKLLQGNGSGGKIVAIIQLQIKLFRLFVPTAWGSLRISIVISCANPPF